MSDGNPTTAGRATAHGRAEPLVSVENLQVRFPTERGYVTAVDDVSFSIEPGEKIGLVGESGAGKSVTAMSLLRMVDSPGEITGGAIRFRGEDVLSYSRSELRAYRGGKVSMVFQDPEAYLNPVYTIGEQIAEAIRIHRDCEDRTAREQSVDILERVGIPDADTRYDDYPHEFSGGMKQRVLIAIALSCDPDLLIADEPTTALDVTTETRILELITELADEFDTAFVFITHDLSVVAELCERAIVMYAGEVVEKATVEQLFHEPMHPYTEGLLNSIPARLERGERLEPIPGQMPSLSDPPTGCRFHPRCPYAIEECETHNPSMYGDEDQAAACLKYDDEVAFDD